MFNFIICDNDVFFLQKLKKAIIDNEEYESISAFKEYTTSFFKIVNDDTIKNKFYILDIETNKQNGVIVASKIRDVDRNSIIAFCTSYEQKYAYKIAKSRFRYDALINKYDDYEAELHEIIESNKKYINKNRRIAIKINSTTTCTIELDELLYIKTEKETQRLIFQTKNQILYSYEALNKYENKLNSDFVKVNRSCFVNKKYAKFNFRNNTILFNKRTILENIMSQTFIDVNKK